MRNNYYAQSNNEKTYIEHERLHHSPKSQTLRFTFDDKTFIDFILNPAVGVVIVGVSSFASCFRIVVLPELSSPSRTIRSSRSDDDLNFLSNERSPYKEKYVVETQECQ